jgi:CrcB protein
MEPFVKILSVAVGGAFGAVARHLVNASPLARTFDNFPLPTFLINVSGSFLIGFLLILLTDRFAASENIRLAVIVGFLGAFTTFSTLEMEIFDLSKERFLGTAMLYMFLSLAAGFVAVSAGVALARRI